MMKQDIILAGVGGQGILSIAFVLDNAALKRGLEVRQAEVHGMSQRGGGVQSHVRLSGESIFSDLIPKGRADMILSVEPLEALRYLEYLGPEGMIISSSSPYLNIPDYPPLDKILAEIGKAAKSLIVDSDRLAKEAGSSRTQNMVMLGAASPYFILEEADLKEFIQALFSGRGENIVSANLKAFDLGRKAALEARPGD